MAHFLNFCSIFSKRTQSNYTVKFLVFQWGLPQQCNFTFRSIYRGKMFDWIDLHYFTQKSTNLHLYLAEIACLILFLAWETLLFFQKITAIWESINQFLNFWGILVIGPWRWTQGGTGLPVIKVFWHNLNIAHHEWNVNHLTHWT